MGLGDDLGLVVGSISTRSTHLLRKKSNPMQTRLINTWEALPINPKSKALDPSPHVLSPLVMF
jgi:hypothetical protein